MDKTQIAQTNQRTFMLTAKSIWENVLIFFLLDVFFGFLIIAIIFALSLLAQYLAYPLVPITLQHIKKATAVLSLIYIVSIFIVSFWRHLSLIKGRNILEMQSKADTSHENITTIKANENNV
ncbi:MAG: hypothetical protein GWP10_20640 [Nitrospiraceae bacterium]|nr:hypothetical protein [Nitrospiraceae bacterium]